ncbi:MAG: alkaline phosphatase D family protein [Phycisphaerales bacterium JB039]
MARCALLITLLIAIAAAPAPADDFESGWDAAPDRVWIGPSYWANRLQDWRLEGGVVRCVETRASFPLRTLFLLTRQIGERATGFSVSVEIRAERWGAGAGGFAGILLGAGSDAIDYRLSAQVHHRPAPDGGLLAVVGDGGRLGLRDNTISAGGDGQWSIGGPLREGDAPQIEPAQRTGDVAPQGAWQRLTVRASKAHLGWTLHAELADVESGAIVGSAQWSGLAQEQIDGLTALVASGGPGWSFRNWSVTGPDVTTSIGRSFGPILGTQYTVSRGTLKLTAQMPPLGPEDNRTASLLVQGDRGWLEVAAAELDPDACTFSFRVEDWDTSRDIPCIVRYEPTGPSELLSPVNAGALIRAEPTDGELVIASLNCAKHYTGGLRWNHDGMWFPHAETAAHVKSAEPDLVFFAGDQLYEGDLDPVDARTDDIAILDYLYKWYRFVWSFRGLMANTPTVTIPDDHDVYHGNLWGAGGRRAQQRDGLTAQDAGGYKMSPRFVNVVHRTQTSHLPDPVDPAPSLQGISVYFTRLDWGGASFAILSDRQFKGSASVLVPEGNVVNGWFQNPEFDPRDADVEGAPLLGARQERFLEQWGEDYSGDIWIKVALSQSPFANVATIPQDATSGNVIPSLPYFEGDVYPEGYKLAADTDSNGWPQSARNRAVRLLRRALAIHLAGDQHLGSLIEYGADEFRDGGYAFTSPAIANTWPRRFFPADGGANREPGAPKYTGDFIDGFGNLMTVHAIANPLRSGREPSALYDRAPGFGIVRLDRASRTTTFECWPRWADPADPGAEQYRGWPRTVHQLDNAGPAPVGYLAPVTVAGVAEPVIQVVDQATGEIVYTMRAPRPGFAPPVFADGVYTVWAGEPGTVRWSAAADQRPAAASRR